MDHVAAILTTTKTVAVCICDSFFSDGLPDRTVYLVTVFYLQWRSKNPPLKNRHYRTLVMAERRPPLYNGQVKITGDQRKNPQVKKIWLGQTTIAVIHLTTTVCFDGPLGLATDSLSAAKSCLTSFTSLVTEWRPLLCSGGFSVRLYVTLKCPTTDYGLWCQISAATVTWPPLEWHLTDWSWSNKPHQQSTEGSLAAKSALTGWSHWIF